MKKTILITATGLISITSTQAQVVELYSNISPLNANASGDIILDLSTNSAYRSGEAPPSSHNFSIGLYSISTYLAVTSNNLDWSWSSDVIGQGSTIDASTLFQQNSYPKSPPWVAGTPAGTNAFLGTRRVEGANTYYGYAQIQLISLSTTPAQWTFIGSAYEATPHKAITIAPIAPVPEPSSTALLGLGALGLLTRRKR